MSGKVWYSWEGGAKLNVYVYAGKDREEFDLDANETVTDASEMMSMTILFVVEGWSSHGYS